MENIKSYSKNLFNKSMRFFVDITYSEIDSWISKATWNDSNCPKDKQSQMIALLLISKFPQTLSPNEKVPPKHPFIHVDSETILFSLEERMLNSKWKVAFKSIVLISELSRPELAGEAIWILLSFRPDIFNTNWRCTKNTHLYRLREQSINALHRYFKEKLNLFLFAGRSLSSLEPSKFAYWLCARFTEQKAVVYLNNVCSSLKLLLEIVFPDSNLSVSFTNLMVMHLAEEAIDILVALREGVLLLSKEKGEPSGQGGVGFLSIGVAIEKEKDLLFEKIGRLKESEGMFQDWVFKNVSKINGKVAEKILAELKALVDTIDRIKNRSSSTGGKGEEIKEKTEELVGKQKEVNDKADDLFSKLF